MDFTDSSEDEGLAEELGKAAELERKKNPFALEAKVRRESPGNLLLSEYHPYEKNTMKKSLFSSSDDDSSNHSANDEQESSEVAQGSEKKKKSSLNINNAYAAKYDLVKRQKELHSLTSKYGKRLNEEKSDSEEDEEDDEAVLLTGEKELAFAEALYAVKRPEKVEKKKFFPPESDQVEYNTRVFQKVVESMKKRKKYTLSDEYQRAIEACADGQTEPSETVDNTSGSKKLVPRSDKEKALRQAFLQGASEVDDFVMKRADEEDRKDEETAISPEKFKAKELIEKAFGDNNATEEEVFLRNFFVNDLWRTDGNEDNTIDYEKLAQAEADEVFFDDAEKWEHQYQENKYRHEESLEEAAQVQTFPRPVGPAAEGLLRKKDTSRKDARQRRMERMAEARQREIEELKRLKHLKKKEIDRQRDLIASVSGLGMQNDADEDAALAKLKEIWSEKDFDAPFDPAEFDKKMAEIFNEDYYDEKNVDDEEIQFIEAGLDGGHDDEDIAIDKDTSKKSENKNISDDASSFDKNDPFFSSNGGLYDTNGQFFSSTSFEDPASELYSSSSLQQFEDFASAKRKEIESLMNSSTSNEEKANKAALLEKLQKELKEKEEEYLQLHQTSSAFKYRKVNPEDFTLSLEEILTLDDRQLNMIAPMNCYAAYLDKNSNQRDRRMIESRRKRGFRQISSDRRSRRYGDVSKTAVLDVENMTEEEGLAIAARLQQRLKEENGSDKPSLPKSRKANSAKERKRERSN